MSSHWSASPLGGVAVVLRELIMTLSLPPPATALGYSRSKLATCGYPRPWDRHSRDGNRSLGSAERPRPLLRVHLPRLPRQPPQPVRLAPTAVLCQASPPWSGSSYSSCRSFSSCSASRTSSRARSTITSGSSTSYSSAVAWLTAQPAGFLTFGLSFGLGTVQPLPQSLRWIRSFLTLRTLRTLVCRWSRSHPNVRMT